jgi:hypothetical protein
MEGPTRHRIANAPLPGAPFFPSTFRSMAPIPSYRQKLPLWLTVYLPLFVLVYPVLLLIPALNWEEGLYREYGFVENLTALLLLVGCIVLFAAAFKTRDNIHRIWLILLALGAFVFCGEEISWGQHYFHWTTPEEWKEANRQRETNLHNLKVAEFLFTKVVRQGLAVATVVGGLVVPMILRARKSVFAPGQIQFWLWPSFHCGLVAILSVVTRLPAAIARELGTQDKLPAFVTDGISETKEAYFALFILLYGIGQIRVIRELVSRRTIGFHPDTRG